MPLVTSLLTAIVRADGDALVLHAGERPYVVAPTGQVELASRALTLDAMKGMLKELLSGDAQHSLDEFGAVQHDLSSPGFARNQKFTVIAARGGDDIWIEIRRHRARVAPPVPIVLEPLVVPAVPVATAQPAQAPPAPHEFHEPDELHEPDDPYTVRATDEPVASLSPESDDTLLVVSEPEPQIAAEPQAQPVIHAIARTVSEVKSEPPPELALQAESDAHVEPEAWNIELSTENLDAAALDLGVQSAEPESQVVANPMIPQQPSDTEKEAWDLESAVAEVHEISFDVDVGSMLVSEESSIDEVPPTPVTVAVPPPPVQPLLVVPPPVVQPVASEPPAVEPAIAEPQAAEPVPVVEANPTTEPVAARPAVASSPPLLEREPETRPAVVLPLARPHGRAEQPSRFSPPLDASGIDRLLRIAAARGASTLYLMSQARPSIRIDGEIGPIDGEGALSEHDVEELLLEIIPERNREALRSQAGTEWICDVPDVGRIRCVTFRDHRGAGGIFRMIPARAISAEQLGLSREIQGLCAEAEGLVLLAGPRTSGKSTLIAAFVNLINRTRSDHVITLETQIQFVHENRGSVVSQREVRGDRNQLISAARTALRESPDVLVIEDFDSPEIVTLALEAAQSGLLVIGALTAHTATDAVNHIIDQAPADQRPKVQVGLAENLRGIVTQVLLRKPGGGQVAAREVLLNTRAVANVIAEGKTSQLPMAIDSGRKHGMVALNDVLVSYVQSGIVDSREAYRRAADHQGFLALLKRQGIDTSFVERLA